MAYLTPTTAVEQSLRQFISSWRIGLQPCVNIRTESDGTIIINTEMICSWPMVECDDEKTSLTNACRKSGRGARTRRNDRRNNFEKHPSLINEEINLNSNVQTDPGIDAIQIEECQSITNVDVYTQTDPYEDEIHGLKTKMRELNDEISKKESQISEFEMIITKLKKPHKHLSAVCVENTNVPPVVRNYKCSASNPW